MPSHSKNKKRKSKSKGGSTVKKSGGLLEKGIGNITAELYNDTDDYPTSRVIKRAPNGDVIVESLPTKPKKSKSRQTNSSSNNDMILDLDSHWEWLSPEEKKNILRIDKDEVFEMLSRYNNHNSNNVNGNTNNNNIIGTGSNNLSGGISTNSNNNTSSSCNCNVCGRRHMAMDQEMERIYNRLYEMQRENYEDMTHIKFHLNIIKDLQKRKTQMISPPASPEMDSNNVDEAREPNSGSSNESLDIKNDLETMRDEVVKYFLSPNSVDTLKKEVLNFKHNKQKQFQTPISLNEDNTEEVVEDNEAQHIYDDLSNEIHDSGLIESPRTVEDDANIIDIESKSRYLNFAKTFISSHPTIAQEYVNKMIMYPEMKELTDDLMNNNGSGFIKAIEEFVLDKQKQNTLPDTEIDINDVNSQQHENPEEALQVQDLGDAKEFTTMLHNGQPLTSDEYANLQRHIAERVTDAYNTETKEFEGISQLEKELFTRFMHGSDRRQFGDSILQLFKNKYDDKLSANSISTSLAAAASTITHDIISPRNDDGNDTEEDIDYYDDEDDVSSENIHHRNDLDDDFKSREEYSDYNSDFHDNRKCEKYNDFDDDDDYLDNNRNLECAHAEHNHETLSTYHHDVDLADSNSHGYKNYASHHTSSQVSEDYIDDIDDDGYESGIDENERLEEGRKLLQITITKILQRRIMESYHAKQAENNRMKLLEELEAEESKKKEKEEKKQRKREKEKEKKRLLQVAKEEERKKKEEEAERLKKEAEEREMERRETQRKKVEAAKKKKDEEKKRKLEEQRKREEEQERQRKIKEEQKRKKDEERKQKELEKKKKDEEKRIQEEEKRKKEEEAEQKTLNEKKRLDVEIMEQKRLEEEEKRLKSTASTSNVPYAELLKMTPSLQPVSGNINDELFGMINAATSSQSIPTSSSHLNHLLQQNDASHFNMTPRHDLLNPSGGMHFGPSDLIEQSHFTHKSNSFDTLAAINDPTTPQTTLPYGNSSVPPNSFDISSWGNFNGSSTAETQLQSQLPQQSLLGSHSVTSDQNRKSFNEELNTITNLLSTTGLEDQLSQKDSFAHSSLWGSQGTSLSGSNPNLSSNFAPAGLPINQTPISPGNIGIPTTTHRSSIWDISSGVDYSLNDNKITGSIQSERPLSNVIPSSYMSPNIWSGGTSKIPVIEQPLVFNPNENQTNPISNIILRELSLLTLPNSTDQYVSSELLCQKVMANRIDYGVYFTELMNLRNAHKIEIASNDNGQVTHVKLVYKSKDELEMPLNSSENQNSHIQMQQNYGLQPISSTTAGNTASTTANNANGSTINTSNSHFFNINKTISNPSVTANIWS
ncbi:hypothetical protein Kpol_1029p17 [Vanderwaltozyma polyspora DSM 70294]|uniref:Stress response protein NST1 n=1 Tax=Vanderwaltozyma polyspora (strain ATCC 22028 / DSM 70294 / BCRC 21397 / CBS 2163 / NBRC 10782 / NRRL Y-8283 / UCD 57-17) TaxID=436907 RepID=NST1_VANPO|nr:uncharacterized protein Kpol_1029p17 [Vanderwaltozyma polyspora DSM 70294]A7TR75.1 RecName: Full=Stress response protein NST1 [Vanderwaltozyma polyspora DSM 70294]EDO15243.1 hypothetical protein Kpol_1029p17 [Vanderwaltozyma polyspora DSM 70294]